MTIEKYQTNHLKTTFIKKQQLIIQLSCTKDELIVHALQALVGCVSGDDELTKENASVGIVGKDEKFILLEGDDLKPYLDRLEITRADDDDDDADAAAGEEEAAEAMET